MEFLPHSLSLLNYISFTTRLYVKASKAYTLKCCHRKLSKNAEIFEFDLKIYNIRIMKWIRNFIYNMAFRMMDFISSDEKDLMELNELKRQERRGQIVVKK